MYLPAAVISQTVVFAVVAVVFGKQVAAVVGLAQCLALAGAPLWLGRVKKLATRYAAVREWAPNLMTTLAYLADPYLPESPDEADDEPFRFRCRVACNNCGSQKWALIDNPYDDAPEGAPTTFGEAVSHWWQCEGCGVEREHNPLVPLEAIGGDPPGEVADMVFEPSVPGVVDDAPEPGHLPPGAPRMTGEKSP